jgi:uncharacterized coiled-coil protein SlyX
MAGMRKSAEKMRRWRHLEERVAELEAEVQECRQVSLRLAELTDVVGELLLPVAQRDQARIDEVLQRFDASVGVPPN